MFQPLETADFTGIVRDMEEVLRGTGDDTGRRSSATDDEFGYRWMILTDEDFEDLVVGINVVSQALQDGGYGERVLCAVFAFQDAEASPSTGSTTTSAGALPVRARGAARSGATTSASCGSRRRSAHDLPGRAGARALVPPLGHPDLAGHGEGSKATVVARRSRRREHGLLPRLAGHAGVVARRGPARARGLARQGAARRG